MTRAEFWGQSSESRACEHSFVLGTHMERGEHPHSMALKQKKGMSSSSALIPWPYTQWFSHNEQVFFGST